MMYCLPCQRLFDDRMSFEQHAQHSNAHLRTKQCEDCSLRFTTPNQLRRHLLSPEHSHRISAKRYGQALFDTDRRWYCGPCDQLFGSFKSLINHSTYSPRHSQERLKLVGLPLAFKCPMCPKRFVSRDAQLEHMAHTQQHPRAYHCQTCDRFFTSQNGLQNHKTHSIKHRLRETIFDDSSDSDISSDTSSSSQESLKPNLACAECNRTFQTEAALHNHLTYASKHFVNTEDLDGGLDLPFKQTMPDSSDDLVTKMGGLRVTDVKRGPPGKKIVIYKCSSTKCRAWFDRLSALVLHLESGACKSKVNISLVNWFVSIQLESDQITDKKQPGSYRSPAVAPKINLESLQMIKSENETFYRCELCGVLVNAIEQLQQHLSSPKHLYPQDPYKCQFCQQRDFGSLSGLTQHLEHTGCAAMVKAHSKLKEDLNRIIKSVWDLSSRSESFLKFLNENDDIDENDDESDREARRGSESPDHFTAGDWSMIPDTISWSESL